MNKFLQQWILPNLKQMWNVLRCFSEYQVSPRLFQFVCIFMPHSSLVLTAWRLESPPVQPFRHAAVLVMSRDKLLLKLRLSGFRITCRDLGSSTLRAGDLKCWPWCSGLGEGITALPSKQRGQVGYVLGQVPWDPLRVESLSVFFFSIPNHFLCISTMISSTSDPRNICWFWQTPHHL